MTVTPRDVDVAVCVQEAVAQLQPMLAGAAVRLEIDLPTQPCMARADPLRLRQVLLNLLTNAVKYNRPGGAVRVRLACGERDASQRITIEVADTGLGMTPEQVACLFQPFNRLGREATGIEGTGIGLVIARSIMALMGGGIEVRSELGVGSTFTLELAASPVTAPDAAAPAAATAPIVRRDDVRGQVLYIDDNEVNRVLMSAFLSLRPNVELTLAEDGAQGLHAAMAKRPGLILIDLLLPGMDGFEVLRTLRARPELAGTPCLVVSASAMPEEIRRAEAAGFDGYLTKPLELSRLLSEIDQRLHAVAHADRSTP
jgi:CheY-like chemotaxis protein/anti-sigma regulatory factor (Ser/Thr protein kinase)